MKKVYIVTYAFKGPATKYQGLYDAIKSFGTWWHYIDNTWLVLTEGNASQIWESLKPHVDDDVNLLVVEMGKDSQGWLPKKAWEWIRKHTGS